MIDKKTIISIRDNAAQDLGAVALRQALIAMAAHVVFIWLGIELPVGVPEGIGAVTLLVVTLAYSWVKTLRNKHEAVALAEDASIGRVIQ